MNGVADMQHGIGHASDWPAAAITDASDHDSGHFHVAPDRSDKTPTGEIDGDGRMGHGHHAGDNYAALPGAEYPVNANATPVADARGHGLDSALGDMSRDGPEYPPKRMRTVV